MSKDNKAYCEQTYANNNRKNIQFHATFEVADTYHSRQIKLSTYTLYFIIGHPTLYYNFCTTVLLCSISRMIIFPMILYTLPSRNNTNTISTDKII